MTTRLPWYEPLLHFFMPNRCMCCDRYFDHATAQALCARCAPSLYPITGVVCECCGHPMESLRRLEPDWPTGRCTSCERARPAYLQATSLWRYDGIISQVLPAIKYGKDYSRAVQLAKYAAPALAEQLDLWRAQYGAIALVPMPMTPKALMARGFNVPTILCQQLQRQRPALKLLMTTLRRRHQRRAQASLALSERASNVQGAFALRRDAPTAPTLCLIDDVLTTGATAHEAAKTLTAATQSRVLVLTLARATEI